MNLIDRLPPTTARVENQTAPELNEAIRKQTDGAVIRLENAPREEIGARLQKLGREWDVERLLQTNASILCLIGLGLGARVDKRFLFLPAAVFSFLAQHALQGWCPPIPIFRRLRVRTMHEIERERFALKVLRGDFDRLPQAGAAPPSERVRAVLAAVDA